VWPPGTKARGAALSCGGRAQADRRAIRLLASNRSARGDWSGHTRGRGDPTARTIPARNHVVRVPTDCAALQGRRRLPVWTFVPWLGSYPGETEVMPIAREARVRCCAAAELGAYNSSQALAFFRESNRKKIGYRYDFRSSSDQNYRDANT
jgi:hypothetical protein